MSQERDSSGETSGKEKLTGSSMQSECIDHIGLYALKVQDRATTDKSDTLRYHSRNHNPSVIETALGYGWGNTVLAIVGAVIGCPAYVLLLLFSTIDRTLPVPSSRSWLSCGLMADVALISEGHSYSGHTEREFGRRVGMRGRTDFCPRCNSHNLIPSALRLRT